MMKEIKFYYYVMGFMDGIRESGKDSGKTLAAEKAYKTIEKYLYIVEEEQEDEQGE